MKFGEKLKSLRIKNELSQEKLAEMLNVSRQAVTKWENQNGIPDIENLKAIAQIFDVTIDSLVYEDEEIKTTDDGFCWNIACTLGVVGLIIAFLFQDLFPSLGAAGIGFGIIGYLLGKTYIIFDNKRSSNK